MPFCAAGDPRSPPVKPFGRFAYLIPIQICKLDFLELVCGMTDPNVTQLLERVEDGEEGAFEKLLAEVYPAMRQMARAQLRGQPDGITLNATGLVHEAYLKLVKYPDVEWKGRAHFFGAASQTMRRIIVDQARSKSAQKRSGERVSLTRHEIQDNVSVETLLEIDDALERLSEIRPRWVRVVECRYFAGLSIKETAEVLGVSHATVSNDWQLARAWLQRELTQ